jgi:predicted HTH domain antitoxin
MKNPLKVPFARMVHSIASSLLMMMLMMIQLSRKIEITVDSYLKGKASLEKSAEMACVSLWAFLDWLRERNVSLKYSLADAEDEIRAH